MKIIEIFAQWIKGLWTAGNILSRLLAIIAVLIGIVIVIILIILNFGIKLFKIFWDETIFYASRGFNYFKKLINILNDILNLLVYYLLKLIKVLSPSQKVNLEKPTLNWKIISLIGQSISIAIFNYLLSFSIFILSLYWILAYVELLCHIGQWFLLLFHSNYSILNELTEILTSLKTWSMKIFSINIFEFVFVWLIRIIGFCGVFLFRFVRLRKVYSDLDIGGIIPYRKPFWNNQIQTIINKKTTFKLFKITLIIALALLVGLLFWKYFSKNDNIFEKQKWTNSDTLNSIQDSSNTQLLPKQIQSDTKNNVEEPFHQFGKGNGKILIYGSCPTGGSTKVWIDNNYAGSFDVYMKSGVPSCDDDSFVSKIVRAGRHHIQTINEEGGSTNFYITLDEDQCIPYGISCD